jgi:hypothetical protein
MIEVELASLSVRCNLYMDECPRNKAKVHQSDYIPLCTLLHL